MKTLETIAGNVYCVTSKNGGTLTDATGTLSEPIEAGKQVHVTAPSDMLLIDDDEAIMRSANFKRARLALRMLGAGVKSELPAGYTRLEFLGGTGTPYINTGVVKSGEYRASCEYAGADKLINGKLFGWQYSADNTTYQNLFRFQALSYLGRFSHESTKGYILPVNHSQQGYIGTSRNRLESTEVADRVVLNGNVVNLSTYNLDEKSNENPQNEPVYLWFPDGVKIYAFSIFNDAAKDVEYIPALDPTGTPCMFDTVTRKPFYNFSTGQFIAGIKDAAQLRIVLRKLPDLTGQDMGTLTLSIPAEANTPEMQELLDTTATQKNWELTIQERPAEAVTYSLRRVRNAVWCRSRKDEHGEYEDSNSVRYAIERCAAVYGPQGSDPAAYGYEPFDSVEDAAAWFGLTPYEYPEELLTETE